MAYQLNPYPRYQAPQQQRIDPLGTIGEMVNLSAGIERLGEYKAERKAQEQAAQQQQIMERAFNEAQGDPHQTVGLLERAGNYGLASTMRDRIQKAEAEQFTQMGDRYKASAERLKYGAAMLQGLDGADPDTVRKAWNGTRQTFLQDFGQTIGPYGRMVPPENADPAHVQQFVDYVVPMGLSASEAATRRSSALATLADRITTAKDQADLDKVLADGMVSFAPTIDDPQEWDQHVEYLRQANMSPRMLEMVGPFEARGDIATRLGVKAPPVKAGTLEHEFQTRAQELGVPVDRLSMEQRNQIRRDYYRSTREPRAATSESPGAIATRERAARKDRNEILRWRRKEEEKISDPLAGIPEEELGQRRQMIAVDTFRQLGVWDDAARQLEARGTEPSPENIRRLIKLNRAGLARDLGIQAGELDQILESLR